MSSIAVYMHHQHIWMSADLTIRMGCKPKIDLSHVNIHPLGPKLCLFYFSCQLICTVTTTSLDWALKNYHKLTPNMSKSIYYNISLNLNRIDYQLKLTYQPTDQAHKMLSHLKIFGVKLQSDDLLLNFLKPHLIRSESNIPTWLQLTLLELDHEVASSCLALKLLLICKYDSAAISNHLHISFFDDSNIIHIFTPASN